MSSIVVVGLLAALLAAGATLVLMRPVLGTRIPWPALAIAGATTLLTAAIGRVAGTGSLEFLIGVSVFALPVLVLLQAAAVASGADTFARWLLPGAWGLVVFPASFLLPLLATRQCLAPDCGFEDFGGALPLVVSAAAFAIPAWLPAGVHERAPVDRPSGRRFLLAVILLWIAVVVWLAHLEGVIDAYTPRIALAAVVAPIASGLGWLIVDVVRGMPRPIGRSLVLGFAVGLVVAIPGAVSVGMPWSPIAGALAGAVGAIVYSASDRGAAPLAARWGATVLAVIAVGFLAPAVSGDTAGLIFSARASVLAVPLIALIAVSAFSIAIAAPVWVIMRRHAARERIPAQILQPDDTTDG